MEFVKKAEDSFILPKYDGESILNVPSTILSLFGSKPLKNLLPKSFYQNAEDSKNIILFLIDGLGRDLFESKALDYTFFQKLKTKGIYNQITSVFPSTTAAALSTIHSGLSPLEHGLPEWYVYFEEFDAVLKSLPFVPVLPQDQNRIKNYNDNILFDQKTIYQTLNNDRIKAHCFSHADYLQSPFNITAMIGANIIAYKNIKEFMQYLVSMVSNAKTKSYFYIYWPYIDSAEHEFGPKNKKVLEELSFLSDVFQKQFIQKLPSRVAKKTTLFVTADHGQVPTDPQKTTYLDTIDGFKDNLKISKEGRTIPPTGNVRDVFLNIKEGRLQETVEILKSRFGEQISLLTARQALDTGLFGKGRIHKNFLSRIGDLIILPHGYETIWYHYAPNTRDKHLGNHGGLTKEEMLVPFISVRLSELR